MRWDKNETLAISIFLVTSKACEMYQTKLILSPQFWIFGKRDTFYWLQNDRSSLEKHEPSVRTRSLSQSKGLVYEI